MGKLIGGLNGPFIGKVGDVIGSSRNGVPYMKGPYKSRTKSISEKEIFNRRKFAAAQLWLKPLLPVVRIGFNGISRSSGGFISAKSYLMRNALKTEGQEIIVDPELVKVSSGDLPMAENVSFSRSGLNELTFTWNSEGLISSFDRDQVMMIAYNIEGNQISYNLTGQFRSVGADVLPLKLDLIPGSVFHIYVAFVASDRSRQSDSLYLGEVII